MIAKASARIDSEDKQGRYFEQTLLWLGIWSGEVIEERETANVVGKFASVWPVHRINTPVSPQTINSFTTFQ